MPNILDQVITTERAGTCGPPWVQRQHRSRYRWAIQYVSGQVVLDAACGLGYGTHMLYHQGGAARVVGLDCSEEAIDHARSTYGENERLSFQLGDVLNLPFGDNRFDVYVSFENIEHLGDVPQYLAEAKRVLKPEGVFLVSTPNRRVTNPRLRRDQKPFNPYHVREYQPEELLTELSAFFPKCELFAISLFSERYVRYLNSLPRLTRHFPARVHQATKVFCELFRLFPSCEVQPVSSDDALRAEYLVVAARQI